MAKFQFCLCGIVNLFLNCRFHWFGRTNLKLQSYWNERIDQKRLTNYRFSSLMSNMNAFLKWDSSLCWRKQHIISVCIRNLLSHPFATLFLVSFLQIFSKSFGIIYFITTKRMASSLRAASTTSVLVAFSFPNRKNSLIGTIQDPTLWKRLPMTPRKSLTLRTTSYLQHGRILPVARRSWDSKVRRIQSTTPECIAITIRSTSFRTRIDRWFSLCRISRSPSGCSWIWRTSRRGSTISSNSRSRSSTKVIMKNSCYHTLFTTCL